MRQKAVRGVLIVGGMSVLGTLVGRIAQIVMPFFLRPIDFGIFALVSLAYGIMGLVAELGMSTDLIRRQERFEEALNTAFTLRFLLSLGLVLSSVAFGWGMAQVFAEPRLMLPIAILAVGLLFQTMSMAPRTLSSRNLDFKRAAIPDNLGKTLGVVVGVIFAIMGFLYWSPVYGTLAGSVIGAVLQIAWSRWRPRFRFTLDLAKDILGFGKFVTLATFVGFVAQSADSVIIGLVLGVESVGFYSVAFSWGVVLTSSLATVLSTVSFPVFSKLSAATEQLQRAVTENVRYYSYAAIGFGAGIMVLAPMFVQSLYGDLWRPAILPMQVLAVVGMILGYDLIAADVLYAIGNSRRVFIAMSLEAATIVGTLPFAAARAGLEGASLSVLIGTLVLTVILYRRILAAKVVSPRGVATQIIQPGVAAATSLLVAWLSTMFLVANLPNLMLAGGLYLGVYLTVLQVVSKGKLLEDFRSVMRLALP